MEKKTLQIDVIGPIEGVSDVVKCLIYYNGHSYGFFMHKVSYEALMYDELFIRDGKSEDSAGVINTTNVFVEEK
ncbi:hypothetical protein [Dysgonomonas macrotermitis]|uniref:Uncharacterized protein n=1 Tax=Dysgonomonas macrotermitis TaxID=1346286 RepID=A0A1M4UME0_9BACT|nr:hypothetical protein [Dysgonomonas macrotermitis]SHE57825.1 hypothetical protein SAMN05444362_101645 [Dysgonomonas macrotermitis]